MTVLEHQFFEPCLDHAGEQAKLILEGLRSPAAYPMAVTTVAHHETHISHVFLADAFAYKIKKPIKTGFLNFTTLEQRHHYCTEEFRLDRRFADDLYIGVVAITIDDNRVHVDGSGVPVEYAVKMHRFPDGALLSNRIAADQVSIAEIHRLAARIATFHTAANRCDPNQALRAPSLFMTNAKEIISGLRRDASGAIETTLEELQRWAESYFSKHEQCFVARAQNGFVRECHGDLHAENIVSWKGSLVPFDGIEFNEDYRWIDVLNDAAFLAMDLSARGRCDLSRLFINSYLEETGDYASLVVLRAYLVYRALIRAMVAKMKASQHDDEQEVQQAASDDCNDHIQLASRFTRADDPVLYITHGLSGSGKTTVSEAMVARHGAIRLRSDIERKRHFGLSTSETIDEKVRNKIYSESANVAIYNRLEQLARGLLQAGYPVIVDAAFLRFSDREQFRRLADSENVPLAILDCRADLQTLRQRIADRSKLGNDASDADLHVLDLQLASQEELTATEQKSVLTI